MLKTQTLTKRILIPLVLSAALAALAVTWMSWYLGHRWAKVEMTGRYQSIRSALESSTFPLTPPVLHSLSHLTGTQWITIDSTGRIQSSTIAGDVPPTIHRSVFAVESDDTNREAVDIVLGSTDYYAYSFNRQRTITQQDQASKMVVLFEKSSVDAVARRAALFPLVTGLSTVCVVSTLMLFVVSRLIGRLRRLESQVYQIAAGNFLVELSDDSGDEVGRLAGAISAMAGQLNQLWERVNQQQSSKLLHQISGGMAHQLRNTLTGAKMAMELHEGQFKGNPPEEVRVAIRQLAIAEDYISRLLTLGNKGVQGDRPQGVCECLDDVYTTHRSIAAHLRVQLDWDVEAGMENATVNDGPSFSEAVSNLMLNAMQAGDHVKVTAGYDEDGFCRVAVSDNGLGIDDSVSQNLFDPFVTSKPEGLGLGLPLVQRAAVHLGGTIQWHRESGKTTFELKVATREGSTACQR